MLDPATASWFWYEGELAQLIVHPLGLRHPMNPTRLSFRWLATFDLSGDTSSSSLQKWVARCLREFKRPPDRIEGFSGDNRPYEPGPPFDYLAHDGPTGDLAAERIEQLHELDQEIRSLSQEPHEVRLREIYLRCEEIFLHHVDARLWELWGKQVAPIQKARAEFRKLQERFENDRKTSAEVQRWMLDLYMLALSAPGLHGCRPSVCGRAQPAFLGVARWDQRSGDHS